MAVDVRGDTPLVVATTANPVTATLDGTRQPQAGDLLLIFHGNDFYALSNMPTPSVSGSTAGVEAVTNGVADAGSASAHIKAYTYEVTSTGDVTVSVTETGSGDEDKMLVVYVLTGADTDDPIDGGDNGAAGAASSTIQGSQPAPSVTPDSADAFLVVHNNSGGGSSGGTPYTSPASPFVELYDSKTGGISYVGGVEQLSASGATGTRTFTGTASLAWAAVSVAIKVAGATVDEATLAATLPLPTASLAATAATAAQLAATLPLPTVSLAATGSVAGQLVAALPLPTVAAVAEASASAVLTAVLPLPIVRLAPARRTGTMTNAARTGPTATAAARTAARAGAAARTGPTMTGR